MEIRQFTVQRLRDYFEINLDEYGYKLYMPQQEREQPFQEMIQELGG